MLRNLNRSSAGRRICGVPTAGILAATIASQTATGDNGPGILYDESVNPANAGKQLRCRITSWPGVGTLFVHESGAVDASGFPEGVYSVPYDWYWSDSTQTVLGGADSFTLTVGGGATAPGATLTGSAGIFGGAASGEAAAPGAEVGGAGGISGGAAGGDGSAEGADIFGAASISGGSTVADGQAPGQALTGTGSIVAGGASGPSSLVSDPRYVVSIPGRLFVAQIAGRKFTVNGGTMKKDRTENMEVTESQVLTFQFADELATGEALSGSPAVSISVIRGGDASPAGLQNGAAEVQGSNVLVPVKGQMAGVDYKIAVTMATSNPKKVLTVVGKLYVE